MAIYWRLGPRYPPRAPRRGRRLKNYVRGDRFRTVRWPNSETKLRVVVDGFGGQQPCSRVLFQDAMGNKWSAAMSKLFRDSHRRLQRQFDTERIADRIEERLFRECITPDDKTFIERMDMFFLATADADGRPNCSYKGGEPGFVRVLDSKTLVFPNYDGNGMYLSMGNTDENACVGMLFIDFENRKRLRVNGMATIDTAPSLLQDYPEAQFVVKVSVTQLFPNCPRYIHKMKLVERSEFVPRLGVRTPVPSWKRMDWARDALPAGDPAILPDDPR
jgi:predicted pyridoxine 5'-phosphate oxidase superfamily flavin-nucleotide-binding protein